MKIEILKGGLISARSIKELSKKGMTIREIEIIEEITIRTLGGQNQKPQK